MRFYQNPKYQFVFFLVIFFVINLLQSNYTALFEDEAYYWVWSKNLAFGYFDHPPLVALWVALSGLFFNGELGVRFFSTLSFSLMLIFIWLLIDLKEKWKYVWLFFLLVISEVFLNLYGFLSTPDTPLLLFVTVFLYSYKRFLRSNSWINTLLLGFSMAAMLYSKYQGILVIFFILLSNLNLLKNKKFWAAGIFGLLLFIPHLHWQYINDYPSFKYHLIERGAKIYKFEHTLIHFVNQVAIVGITFPVIYWAFFKQRIITKFDRSLKFITLGFIVFFFFSSFSSNPQAQWTAPILIPLIVLTFPYFVHHQKIRKWLIILGSVQLVILLMIRVFLANENISPVVLEPHQSKPWIYALKEKTQAKPIVFVNSYRNASLYTFYTDIKTHSYSILRGRKSQYDLTGFEKNIQHEEVYVASKFVKAPFLVKRKDSPLNGFLIKDYVTFQNVECIIPIKDLSLIKNEKVEFSFKFINTTNENLTFENVKFMGVFQGKKNIILEKVPLQINDLANIEANRERVFKATFICPNIDYDDKITFRIALRFYNLSEGYQGNKINVKLKN